MVAKSLPGISISKLCRMLILCVACSLAMRASTARMKSVDGSTTRYRRHNSTPPRRGKKKGGDDKQKKRGQIRFPAISMDDMAAYDLDSVDSTLMAEEYLKKEVPFTNDEAAKCCCKHADDGGAECAVLRGTELATSRNPWKGLAAVCPKSQGYHGWDNKKHFSFVEYPSSCREIDFNDVLRDLVPDHKRAHEAMLIAEATLEDAVGPDIVAGNSGRCCCKVDADPSVIDCSIMAAVDLENGNHCPSLQGYRLWKSSSHSFRLSEPPAICQVNEVDRNMKQFPRNFAIIALVASSALDETRYAIDPVASAMMHANVEIVRRRLEEVMALLEQTITAVREWWEIVHNRGALIGAEFLFAVAGGAIQRALRFLTPVASKADVDDTDGDTSGTAHWSSMEADSDLMREFASYNFDDNEEHDFCTRIEQINPRLRSAIWSAAFLKDVDDCGEHLDHIQTTLRKWGAWWRPKVQIKDASPSEAKTDWANSWSQIKASLDFTPWPLEPHEHEMIVPAICEADYLVGDETARYPKILGGEPIMHTYMIFAGGENNPTRPGCLDIVIRMAELFPDLPRRGEKGSVLSEYEALLAKSDTLGCHGLVPLGRVWLAVNTALEEELGEHGDLSFDITFSKTEAKSKLRIKTHSTGGKKKNTKRKKQMQLQTTLIKWISHTIVKYAARAASDDWVDGVEKSLRRTPPSISAHELSAEFWSQLSEQNVPSPYDDTHCPDIDQPGCGDWDRDSDVHWDSAYLGDASLEVAINAVKKAHDATRNGDWRLLAQTPIAYGGTGFDAPGIVDNSDWHCGKTVETCSVHPRCARAAAQMISRPFMQKKYASDWAQKLKTYLFSNASFDKDGFHSYCHGTQDAYCWSYTGCLKEMLNYLCSQEETSEECCPNPAVAAACKANVNGEDCNVCEKTVDPENAQVPRYTVGEASKETIAWLRPGLAEAEVEKCLPCEGIRRIGQKKPIWGGVQVLRECTGKEEECRDLCGLEEGADDFADCVGWESRCYDAGC